MKRTVQIYISAVTLLASLLMLPITLTAGIEYSALLLSAVVLLMGASAIFIIYLLWEDDFSSAPDAKAEQRMKLLSLGASVVAIIGQLLMRLFMGFSSSSMYGVLMMGIPDMTALKLLLFYALMIISGLSVTPIFMWSMDFVDTTQYEYVRRGYLDGVEMSCSYFTKSEERPVVFTFALMSAVLGILTNNLLLLFVVLAINICLTVPNKRIASTGAVISVLTGIICLIATVNGVSYELESIPYMLDLFPIPLFGVIMLIKKLYADGKIYVGGMYGIFIPGMGLSMALAALLGSLLSRVGLSGIRQVLSDYVLPVLAVVFILLTVWAIVSFLLFAKKSGRLLTSERWQGVICALLVPALCLPMLSVCLRGDVRILDINLGGSSAKAEAEYTLYDNADFVYGGVKYGVSDKGLVALEVVDTEAEQITLSAVNDLTRLENVGENALERLAEVDGAVIYAIATGFLKGNNAVTTLTLSGGITVGFFEKECITDCPSLTEVALYHRVIEELDGAAACTKASFDLGNDTRFTVCELENVIDYATSLKPLGSKLVYAHDVYFRLSCDITPHYFSPQKFDSVYASASCKGNVMGVKGVTLSLTTSSLSAGKAVKVFSKGDPVKYREGGAQMKASYSVDGRLVTSAWVLNNYSAFGGAASVETKGTHRIFDTRSHTDCSVTISTALTYTPPEN